MQYTFTAGGRSEATRKDRIFLFLPPFLSFCLSVSRGGGVETFFWRPPRIDWSRCFHLACPSVRTLDSFFAPAATAVGRTMTAAAVRASDLSIIHRRSPLPSWVGRRESEPLAPVALPCQNPSPSSVVAISGRPISPLVVHRSVSQPVAVGRPPLLNGSLQVKV